MGEDYKPNSHKFREDQTTPPNEKKQIEKVVRGSVKTRPKRGVSKLADVFVSEDISNVKSHIMMDVIVPAVKKVISDIVRDGIDMLLYGDTRGNRSSSSYISYRDYTSNNVSSNRSINSPSRTGYNHDDIILETREEAEEVLERMDELIETYGVVSVADVYDLIGISCNYTDNKYGWTNIRNAEPIHVHGGYLLKLPKALPIK